MKGRKVNEEAAMDDFIFTPEYHEDGLSFYYGKRVSNGQLYRWEPVATRLRWGEAGNFRRKAAARSGLEEETLAPGGILPVIGPVTYRGQTLIGWAELSGEPLFGKSPLSLPLGEGLTALERLLLSYHAYHRQGLNVGCPDWRRIYWGSRGIYMPDPLLLPYLARPAQQLPVGLSACHPPELYCHQPLDQKGDLFYLGVLVYLVITGNLPYLLVRGWPTEGLRQGIIIPPAQWRPDIPPALGRLMERLLAVKPEERPGTEELINTWHQPRTAVLYGGQIKKEKTPSRWIRGGLFWRMHRHRWRRLALALSVILLLFGWWRGRGAADEDRVFPRAEELTVLLGELADPGFPDYLLLGAPKVWGDLLNAKEERREAAAALLEHPLLTVKKVILLWQEEDCAQFEIDLVWYHWRDNRWQTIETRERMKVVRRRNRWAIEERQKL